MARDIEKLLDLTRQAKILMRHIQAEALQEVRAQKIPGVTTITDTVGIVKLRTVAANENLTLDPNFYLIESQIKAIRSKLQNVRTFSEMCRAVESMIDSASVTINKEKTVLHPVVVAALKSSDIGAYITDRTKGD